MSGRLIVPVLFAWCWAAGLAGGASTPSLRQIMSDPQWVARSPGAPAWSWDGASVWFEREREGERLVDQWRVPAGGGDAEPVADENLFDAPIRGGEFNAERTLHAFSREGDVFVRDMRTGALRQLTRTDAREGGAMFMVDGSLAFQRGGDWLIRDAQGLERQAAEIRAEDAPTDDENKTEKDDATALEKRQEELFQIVRDRRAREKAEEDLDRARRQADPTRVPGPFYLGKGWVVHERWLSPAGRWMLLVVSKDPGEETRDVMPAYVTEDGYVSTSRVRPKVGHERQRDDRLVLLDLETEATTWLGLEGLPMITDDPLAWLKDEAELAKGDGETKAEDASEDKPTPRAVTVQGAEWSPDGTRLAVQLRSNDNKDRWIATVEPAGGEPSLVCAHHLRDEAWINWDFNEMGWTHDSETLWFLSEESGYGHLYAWEAGRTRRLTGLDGGGRFTVIDVRESPEGGVLYYRANRMHPGVYELESVTVAGGEADLRVLTLAMGTVEAYAVSPDGTRVAYRWSTAMDPPELYVVDVSPDDERAGTASPPAGRAAIEKHRPRRLTFTDSELYRSFDWVSPRFVEVPSSHGEQPIHCRVYDDPGVPAPSEAGKPVVLFAHGAGYTQHVYNGWSYYFREHMFHTLLCRLGYVVIAPDFRASEGYGRDWRTAIYRRMGFPELEDFDDCLAWLDEHSDADLGRVGIYGGSYGGFMTLMAMFLRPDVYDCGAALRSVTDWMHYNDGYTSNILNRPEVDPKPFVDSSPISHAEGLTGALLMCHGMLDDNVVAQDTIRLAQRLIELEKDNWEMALYPVEPHGFREPTAWLDEYRRILRLFEAHLKD